MAGLVVGHITHYKILKHQVVSLQADVKKEQNAHRETKAAFSLEAKKWSDQVERQRQELAVAKAEKQAVVAKRKKELSDLFKTLDETHKRFNEAVEQALRNDIVTVPAGFVVLYDDAVEGANLAAQGGAVRLPEGISRTLGGPVAFDAAAFTKSVVGNVWKCAEWGTQYNVLRKTVKDVEAKRGTNIGGTEGTPENIRGDVPSGSTGANQ